MKKELQELFVNWTEAEVYVTEKGQSGLSHMSSEAGE